MAKLKFDGMLTREQIEDETLNILGYRGDHVKRRKRIQRRRMWFVAADVILSSAVIVFIIWVVYLTNA